MGNNRLEAFQQNTKKIYCFVTDTSDNVYNLTGFTAALYGKKLPITANSTVDISINYASIDTSNGEITFDLRETDTEIAPGDYSYEVVIDNSTNGTHVSVVQDLFVLKDSIAYD